ncbi:HTH-type transcriptional activator RhaS [Marinomonas spartinae]|uniref:HTH-type transcriptional activator RhaS n=1 Tax=Marinomonas spartinae TaxID=1792290 RepID=A0A1A8T1M1_9GAMM|nr:AraC family transcriptional regulator [Marinomonas spartinae]SBS25027.1 HTH-type transcriptional activator RhaS [Marinomonas spartinae]SBS25107.1 HTH-type transcriptional activator RhaS [Marinomonas spartinae]
MMIAPEKQSSLVDLLRPIASLEGIRSSLIDQVRLIKCSRTIPRSPLMYQPSLTIIAQGKKVGYLGEREIHYNSGHYLVQTLPLPFECETFATVDEPLLGLSILIDPSMLAELVVDPVEIDPHKKASCSPMASVAMSNGMQEAVIRLVRALHDETTAKMMGTSRVREVIFEALQSSQGDAIRALVANQGLFSRIVLALKQMHTELDQEIRVEQLAENANMSASSFHHHFKSITGSSPLQYLKRLRLLKAQMLLNQGLLSVGLVSFEVGYKSVQQFSRDYKRYFGVSPTKDKLRENTVV